MKYSLTVIFGLILLRYYITICYDYITLWATVINCNVNYIVVVGGRHDNFSIIRRSRTPNDGANTYLLYERLL
jgi:hypothetical protein